MLSLELTSLPPRVESPMNAPTKLVKPSPGPSLAEITQVTNPVPPLPLLSNVAGG